MIKIRLPKKDLYGWLQKLCDGGDPMATLNSLVEWLRRGGTKHAAARTEELLQTLHKHPELAREMGRQLFGWLAVLHIYPALVTLGIFSREGFGREAGKRLYDRFNPPPRDPKNLRDVFLKLFYRQQDRAWLQTIPGIQWQRFYQLLIAGLPANTAQTIHRKWLHDQLHAIEMLAIWIAAEELDPKLILIDPKLLEVDSPFLALSREVFRLLEHQRSGNPERFDDAHLQVMLDQSEAQIDRLRKRGAGAGTGSSLSVAHLLERLEQTLDRLKVLLAIQTAESEAVQISHTLDLLHHLAGSAGESRSISLLWKRSVKMLARSISQNTSGRGEKYITTNRSEYFAMLRSAAVGGVLIALMALLKLKLGMMGLSKLQYAVFSSLDYGIGFALIHMIHGTVATKQPAMTASNIAQQIERSSDDRTVDQKLAKISVDLIRSQAIAVFGNMSVAILLATVITFAYDWYTGLPILSKEVTDKQFLSVLPFSQPTLIYAAIAGVWLFCAGIISGFFDNRANYLNMRERLRQHPLMVRLLPAGLRGKVADYLHQNYGALMGNFIFGVMLGSTSYVGHLFGLPLDIRHVAFSSANIAYAAAVESMSPWIFMIYLGGVLLIGIVNLWVSFTLTLWIALRSRDAHIGSLGKLLRSVWQQIVANPMSLLFPVQAANQMIKEQRLSEKTENKNKDAVE
ncbi:site-specific recombinase [Neisseria sp.]|uniref:site-specific recombinase n=1 Tax=Neisseria sp. TaxID=192066 RepID=UPI0028A2B60B|nr:site-specific recombinase [Neisseria sp.]